MEHNLTNEQLYKQIEDEIVTLKIPPGEILSENTLCKRLNISRTPVRSLLQRLAQNGFVQIVPNRGTIVTAIDLNIASQGIYQRLAVECMVLRDFLNICSPTDMARLSYIHQQLLEIGSDYPEKEDFDINHFLSVDLSAHQVWFQATNKMYLWETLTRPQADYSRFIRLDIMKGGNVPDVLKEHEELLYVIEEKAFDAIEPLLKRHLYGGVRRLGGQIFSEEYKDYFKA